ncbi:response regulator [Paenibacillus spongiae]|uniref:Response regulator n=1 Tax=Paenibacillus spongiae TaxID=2909671 RepID=A0ABY5S5P8_9BACL|nr:response regulator [Paenibacillus spongiae]UVI27643.1 response regulator [Paenibacillus spongiae]
MLYLLILLPAIIVITMVIIMSQRRLDRNKPVIIREPQPLFEFDPPLTPPFEPSDDFSEETQLLRNEGVQADYTVLIVDDQPAIRMLLRELFELEGIAVFEAPHGRTAIELVKRAHIDFILLDLKMPDMDGIEALRAIREINPHVHVAMITAYGDPDKLEAAQQLGVLASFTKPFDIDIVKKFVISKMKS